MSKGKTIPAGGFLQELLQVGIYKRSQGRVTRQVTFAAIAVAAGLAAWRLFESGITEKWFDGALYLLPALLLAAGLWFGYRIVNLPSFADFLIAVEAEMNKVSWPSRAELFRSSLVVIFVIFSLALILYVYDAIWKVLFAWLRIVY